MNLDRDADETQGTWDHLGWSCKRFLFQAYFWSFPLHLKYFRGSENKVPNQVYRGHF